MRSNVSVTQQIDDVETAARELLEGAKSGFPLANNSVGILFCYSDMEAEDLLRELSNRADFDIVGCTAIANMDERTGFHDMAATLTLLTSDDVRFVTASSEPITPANVSEQIERTYRAAADRLGETPALLVALPPYRLEIMLDAYANGFNAVAPGVPVVGGLPSYNATGDSNLTFHNGTASADRMVLLAMAGDVRPVFSVQNVTSNDAERKRKVTRARDNVVYEVGNQRFTDYLAEIGLPVD
ncbi:hypothetical protein LJC31_07200, partial [Synergistaceae bacterium OttesenSCG-928-I11]|nr:hypothetical protein [Synergistaceae bacterium OttesenSCG-928-I11]